MGKSKLLLGIGAGLLLLLVGFGIVFLNLEPSMDEKRSSHLDSLVKLLEAYHAEHGFYPQPAAREETIDGVKHVWGYRADAAALASCSASSVEASCGGDIYDARGKVIGWKGTVAITSGLNSVEVAQSGGGRLLSPLSETLPELPGDPVFALDPELLASGFGEYVYAVRAPEDGATNKGGVQYQLAATIVDVKTGKLHTTIRGNYFVSSQDEDILPPSLIGPGILLDAHGNPIPSTPLHVLLDGQQEGFPNPLLGEGESILRLLQLQGRLERLNGEIGKRQEILAAMPKDSPSSMHLTATLQNLQERLRGILDASTLTPGKKEEEELVTLEAQLGEVAQGLEDALTSFLQEKSEEVREVLAAEADSGEIMRLILSGALLRVQTTEELVLLARDELIKYLDGEGIEEQSRDRAGRRVESALDGLPDLVALFSAAGLTLPLPFLLEDVQAEIHALSDAIPSATTASGALMGEPVPMITTVAAELSLLFEELRGILEGIAEDLSTNATSIEDTDESLRKLSRALGSERARIEMLFHDLASAEEAKRILDAYEAFLLSGDSAAAIMAVAARSGEHGDFSPLLFTQSSLEALILEKQVGVPDSEYTGIPYPLP